MPLMKTATAAYEDRAAAAHAGFVCRDGDSLFLAIQKCLDNRTGVCLVVDDGGRLLGRVTLESARAAIRAGELAGSRALGASIALVPEPGNEGTEGIVTPLLDAHGALIDVALDRSRAALPLAKPDLTSSELESLLDAFLSTWISSRGPYVSTLEEAFARFIGIEHGIAVSSGTAALQLALAALGIGPGHEVVVPDLTFAATINAVLHSGATPVIADIDRDSWGLDPTALEKAITSRTKAVIVVHLYGRPVLPETIAVAQSNGLFVIEDCAEAQGARLAGRRVGSLGDVGCFSLFANKMIAAGEGGVCVTGSTRLAQRIRLLRDHGVSPKRPLWHEEVGFSCRLTNLQAAIAASQVSRFDEINANRNRVADLYQKRLGELPGVRFPPRPKYGAAPVSWLITVIVPPAKRDALIAAAAREQIELRAFFNTLSSMPPYHALARECPESIALSKSGLCLPSTGNEDRHAVEKIAGIFRSVLG